jgi:hypothetical protein
VGEVPEIYVQCMVMHGQELSALQGFEQAQSTGEAKKCSGVS